MPSDDAILRTVPQAGFEPPSMWLSPPEEVRQSIAMLLRGTAERIASRDLEQLLEDLLGEAESRGMPSADVEVGASTAAHAANELLGKAGVE